MVGGIICFTVDTHPPRAYVSGMLVNVVSQRESHERNKTDHDEPYDVSGDVDCVEASRGERG